MRTHLPARVDKKVRTSTLVLAVVFVGLFVSWVMVRNPSTGSSARFTPLGAATAHFRPHPTQPPAPFAPAAPPRGRGVS